MINDLGPELEAIYSEVYTRIRRGQVNIPTNPSKASAKIITDSVSPNGVRLTTLEVKLWRPVLAELNTHRAFSRNAASSRAIPIAKLLKRVLQDPAAPVWWGKNQSGMQAEEQLEGRELEEAQAEWYHARDLMVKQVLELSRAGLHKQLANRLLEPWLWVTDIISSTRWKGFFRQRCHSAAQPEFRAAAEAVRASMLASLTANTPVKIPYKAWHLPYIQEDERNLSLETLQKVSTARCARISYLTHGGIRDVAEDLAFFTRLTSARPMHVSPLEHVATPDVIGSGNFVGWTQLRKFYEEEDFEELVVAA